MEGEMFERQVQIQLAAPGFLCDNGRFVIDAITAGQAKGWDFKADVLQSSLELWNGAEVFVDHGGLFTFNRSIRDLGGVLSNPRWKEDNQGIRCDLETVGPSKALVDE